MRTICLRKPFLQGFNFAKAKRFFCTVTFVSLFAAIFSFGRLEAQFKIGGSEYSGALWGENELLDPIYYQKGSLLRSEQDFILAAGKTWQGEPPISQGAFQFEGKTISNCGNFNNEAVLLLQTADPVKRAIAIRMLEAGVKFDPAFFAFRYNLGRAYHIEKNYQKAILQFEYGAAEVPQYYRSYIHLGVLYELLNEQIQAVIYYKKAVERNEFQTEALVLLGEHYIKTDLRNRAQIYIKKALSVDEHSPDAKLGLARLEILSGRDYYAYKILRNTDLYDDMGKKRSYNKKFHFFFAETASKIGDYVTAAKEYDELLKFPNDPFFSEFSYKIIQRRRDLAQRFADIKALDEEENNETGK
ncbi:hypothetical protein CH373_11690 [Leptospira perolatii]|uniref:Uncharacterized protein n=1 Tax=Leptospira perolatii TaxID=2023191 RepID=A0A2M9ZM56_9LEPT|nr:hypothetical protein [Leptospira perolatii]PJZ69110.1 hypothetical protein CH360_12575 [Leptospira perolatii]PJZ73146.1 hypothetical protein CH373_11690 [Leptospira perolatii]